MIPRRTASRTNLRPNARRPGRIVFAIARAALVVLHLLLLWERIADATLLDPVILGKWIAGALLVSATFLLQRFAPAVMRTRRAGAVFWLLVLLLHVAVPVGGAAEGVRLELTADAGAMFVLGLALVAVARVWTARPDAPLFLRQRGIVARRHGTRAVLSLRAPPLAAL